MGNEYKYMNPANTVKGSKSKSDLQHQWFIGPSVGHLSADGGRYREQKLRESLGAGERNQSWDQII